MFHAEPIPVFFAASPRPYNPALRNPRAAESRAAESRTTGFTPTEALRTMPSALNRSAAFEQLALPLFASLYNHAQWLTRDQAEAEDLVQETFTKALRAFDSFQAGTNFKAWIFRILRNTFLTSRTGIAASHTVFLEDHPDTLDTTASGPTPEDILLRLDNHAAIHTALEQLQPQLREVLLLCDVEEIKYKDIAVILDVPIGTVMSRISRARRTLRQLLQPHLGESL
jgi:RNA polymerase sigma-70 factor (ECF subfamily)